MEVQSKARSKVLWTVGLTAMLSLTGCGMYPSKPGAWPNNFWGSALHEVSRVIDFFANHLGNDYGLALLVVTILVRLLILPLMVKQIRYSKTLQALQPQLKDVRDRYKGDNQRIQQETMKIWQEHGVNPMSGCLPMIVQLPVLYALYGAIEGNVALNHSSFLWVASLGKADHLYILPLLAAITTYFSSKVMMTGQDSSQKMMLFIMPVIIFLMGTKFPAGLALYWVYTNLFTAVQTYFIKVRPAAAAAAANATVDVGKVKSKKKK